MWGFSYRRAVALKDLGERLHLNWLIRLGLKIKDWVMKHGKI
jgi:hypothetical protein